MSRVVIVTGAGGGIGRRLAIDLFAEGHGVVLTDVVEQALEETRRLVGDDADRVMTCGMDVRRPADWERLLDRTVQRFGRVDVLLNVAGYLCAGWSHQIVHDVIERTVDVNVKGVMYGSTLTARRMMDHGGGHIVNFSSLAGIAAVPGNAIYSASKHAVRGFSLAIAQEYRRHKVFVTVVCPALVATPMMDVQLDKEEAALTFSGPRALRPEEVSRAILRRVLVHKPVELVLAAPFSAQGILAKIGNMFPSLAMRLTPSVTRAARARQTETRMAARVSDTASASHAEVTSMSARSKR